MPGVKTYEAWVHDTSPDVESIVENKVAVYPNPMSDVLNIELGDSQTDIVIYNSLGQVVRRYENMSGDMQINVAELKSGMYFIRINNETTKVIKR